MIAGSDIFAVQRDTGIFKAPLSDVLAYIQTNIGTSEYRVANIAARNALANLSVGDRVMVDDATTDSTVTTGWALYMFLATGSWRKITEQESQDVTFNATTNLTYSPSPTNGVVNSSSGSGATIPLATGTNAGLMPPGLFTKSGFLTVTETTDLDAMRQASHAAVTTAGAANSNPIVVTGQELSFSIANLEYLP